MTNDSNTVSTPTTNSSNNTTTEGVLDNKLIQQHKLKHYENDMVNTGCLYQLFAPFLLLFGMVPSQQNVLNVKPPTREETSSLLMDDDSESGDEDYDLYNRSNIDQEDGEDNDRIIRHEKTILDHEHNGLSGHDELESYLNQSLENTTSILHKDEQKVYSKFKDSSYRNIHRESTEEITQQIQNHASLTANNLIHVIETTSVDIAQQENSTQPNHDFFESNNTSTSTSQLVNNANHQLPSHKVTNTPPVNTVNNSQSLPKQATVEIPTNDNKIIPNSSSDQLTPSTSTSTTKQTNFEDEEEEMNFGSFQQHYEDDSGDDIEINYQ